jgi:dihydrofolate reductase
MKKQISIIVAIAQNNAIGKNNELLWHIPNDLKRFKKLTSGHNIIMGKKTYQSLPFRPLPNRTNIVITDIVGEVIEGCKMAYSIKDAVELMDKENENFIIGGGSVYKQFLPLADKLYLTVVHKDFDADIFFPEINFDEWEKLEEIFVNDDDSVPFNYSYLTLKKR